MLNDKLLSTERLLFTLDTGFSSDESSLERCKGLVRIEVGCDDSMVIFLESNNFNTFRLHLGLEAFFEH